MAGVLWILAALAVAWYLAASRASLALSGGVLVALGVAAGVSGAPGALAGLLLVAGVGLALLAVGPLREALMTGPLLGWFRKALPQVSATEQEALDAGTVWWDGELFSGRPDWKRLLAYPRPSLTPDEQAFVDGPTEELCAMLDDWQITHELNDLPPEAWKFIKDKGFLGMIIPRDYGGLGFSAQAHSAVVTKLASRSGTAAVSVMVPNSLGPAELLLHYGTEEQKRHYLPRLAKGQEMPCFALTGPDAGSDAASIPDFAVVCKGEFEGRKDVLGMKVTWEKRYITLGPIATILGLAFRLRDPDRLLGGDEDLGITLALIPTHHKGVNIGRRHAPLNAAFQNGPNSGKDVFIPMDWVIGGRERVGQGWRMLMECLAAGRSISLPGSATGAAKLAAFTTGAYARVRQQFRTPIGRFEGVEEALGRIGGNAYLMEATRVMTAGAVDLGEKPSVISAIAKYHITERGRQVINDAMDVHGGKGICMGPGNYLARGYQQAPIGITVEGANILTRSMIIFGQGAIRCHPYVLKEIAATRQEDRATALREFDRAFRGHVSFSVSNAARALFHGLTRGCFADAGPIPELAPEVRTMSRFAAAFAFAADLAMLVLGGALKRKEMISARLGDVLSQLYLASTVVKRFEDDGRPAADLPLARWALADALYRAQEGFAGLAANFPTGWGRLLIRLTALPLGRPVAPPSDRMTQEVARILIEPSEVRDRLCRQIHIPATEADPVGALAVAIGLAVRTEALDAKLRAAAKAGTLSASGDAQVAEAVQKGVINADDAEALARMARLRRQCIMVDDFPADFASRAGLKPAAVAQPARNAA